MMLSLLIRTDQADSGVTSQQEKLQPSLAFPLTLYTVYGSFAGVMRLGRMHTQKHAHTAQGFD